MSEDRFAHDDAAYVLGALSPQEHAEFEAHLLTCTECTARVRELADIPALLSTVPFDDVTGEIFGAAADDAADQVPDTLLPGLLRQARAEQHRRRWVTGGLAGLAAACLIALAVLVWPSSSPSSSAPQQQAMAALVSSPIHATAAVEDRQWGTEISLRCRYDEGSAVPSSWAYGLTVIGKDGAAHPLGTWTLVAGHPTKFSSGTALKRDQIKSIEITGPDGVAILQLAT